jgi:S-ribosylhomocysteine lyase
VAANAAACDMPLFCGGGISMDTEETKKKYNVDSFNLDHTKVTAPFVRLAAKKVGRNGDVVTKFDIRFCQPNKECMPTGAIHTLEHLIAEYIRDEIKGVIDFSPMGCRTGFYFTIWGDHDEAYIAGHMLNVMKKVAVWDKPIPAATEKECGNYRDHDLDGAKMWAQKWVDGIEKSGWNCYK